jgi:hypothetical protein
LSVGFTGTNPGDFAQTNNCGTSLAVNANCTINVTFTPGAVGSRSGTLAVTDSAGTQSSGLSGTGTSGDVTPPTTQITTPSNGASLSNTVTVTATATDNVGVTSIQIYIDGAQVATGTSSPLNYSWNTTNATNGTHPIYSKASDAAGNVGTSATVTVTVSNVSQLLQNTSFETGLSNWTAGGALIPSVTTAKHNTGSYSAVLGSTVAPQQNGDSWLLQSVTIPSTSVGASLNYFYWGVCNDTLVNAWQEVQIQSSTGTVLAQVQKTCETDTGWSKVYFNLLPYKGQTVRIYLNAHGSGNNNATYLYVDDVTVSVK